MKTATKSIGILLMAVMIVFPAAAGFDENNILETPITVDDSEIYLPLVVNSYQFNGNQTPYMPTFPSPASGEINQSIDVDLSWLGGDPNGDDVTYDVYFEAENSSPSQLLCTEAGSNSCDPGILTYNSKYYWQVIARDEHGATADGPIWNFATGSAPNNPPNDPSDPSPGDGDTDQSIEVDLSWLGGDPDGDDVTYDIYFEADNSAPNQLLCTGASSPNCDPGILNYDTKYYWQVIARDVYSVTADGPVWSFTTGPAPNNLPYEPSDPNPAAGAAEQSVNSVLNWQGGDPDGDSVTYDVYVAANNATPNQLLCDDTSNMSCDPGTLNYSTHYYWQVIAKDEHGITRTGPVWNFMTEVKPNNPPNEPNGPSPAHNATDQSVDVILQWSGDDPDEDVVTYDVFFEANDSSPDTLSCNDIGDATCDPGTLQYNTTYYWLVVARDEHGASASGSVWKFKTENRAPDTPSNPSPANEAADQDIDVNLSWSGGDPDGDDVSYDVYFEPGDNTPDQLLCNDMSSPNCDPGTLTIDTIYYWQVVARDEHGAVESGPVWQFTTAQPECVPNLVAPEEGAIMDNGRTDRMESIIWDFDWEECPEATQYHLYVKLPTAQYPVIDRISIGDSSYQHVSHSSYISGANRYGWEWMVRSMVAGQWGPWSAVRSFDVEPANSDPAGMPDLIVTELTINSMTSDSIEYSYTIKNEGTARANLDGPSDAEHDNVKVQAFLSNDTVFNNSGDVAAGGTILGLSPLGYLLPGETFSGSFAGGPSVDPSSMNFLILKVDWGEVVNESNETNNTLAVPTVP